MAILWGLGSREGQWGRTDLAQTPGTHVWGEAVDMATCRGPLRGVMSPWEVPTCTQQAAGCSGLRQGAVARSCLWRGSGTQTQPSDPGCPSACQDVFLTVTNGITVVAASVGGSSEPWRSRRVQATRPCRTPAALGWPTGHECVRQRQLWPASDASVPCERRFQPAPCLTAWEGSGGRPVETPGP